MRDKTPAGDLAPLDLEIKATCRRNNVAKKRKELENKTTDLSDERIPSFESFSSFPIELREAEVGASRPTVMEEDQPPRVTLEDYSSSTMPQFFTSIARTKVQATNISYPHSLIQLIQGNLFMVYQMKTLVRSSAMLLSKCTESHK